VSKFVIIAAVALVAIATGMLASTIVIGHAQATLSGEALRRANNNLDQHIAAGGVHGAVAQQIKNQLNSGGGCGPACGG
jgi:hypothetical protein